MGTNVLFVTRRFLVLFASVVVLPALASAQTTAFFYDSQPGDWIGAGQRRTILPGDAATTAQRNVDNGVSATVIAPGSAFSWYLDVSDRYRFPLVPTVYTGARWYQTAEFGPGLSFYGSGRGCRYSTGWFQVLEIEFGIGNTVTRFAVDFEHHCDDSGAATFGAFR